MNVWLIGAGGMAQDYDKILKDIDCNYTVIGRGEASSSTFTEKTGTKVVTGGIDKYIESTNLIPDYAIVATGVEALSANCISLINAGVKKILVEKPAGLNREEIEALNSIAEKESATVYVAYNRRFFSSVLKAQEIIAEDGGVSSFNFEFTEWSHVIEKLTKADGVLEHWFLANSTHVVDLAFYLGGKPKELTTFLSGSLDWHSKSSNFAGAGISENDALFTYSANWEAPGRWRMEILTKKHRLYFSPMEKLQIQELGSVALNDVEIDDTLDKQYKPGLFNQVDAFLNNNDKDLCSIKQQTEIVKVYNKIAGYEK